NLIIMFQVLVVAVIVSHRLRGDFVSKEEVIEERLQRIIQLLDSSSNLFDQLDIEVPKVAQDAINELFNSKEIKEIVNDIKTRRPPKIVLMGRSGVGKSSLINAMFGTYLAETSAIKVRTVNHEIFQYKKNGKVIFEMIDTRGIKENMNEFSQSAEEDLNNLIKKEAPDAFLFLTNGADRTTLKEDAEELNRIFNKMEVKPPLITVITRVDEINPGRFKKAEDYPIKKLQNIKEKEREVGNVLIDAGIKKSFIVPVSSYMEWNNDDPENLSENEREKLKIIFDGRYNIDKLLETLEDNVDLNVAIDMMFNHKIDKAIEKIATIIVKRFTAVSGVVGASPIPVADILVLLPLQIIEVMIVAYLSGKEISGEAAREFILSLGAVFLFGFGLKFVAQQGTKLLNVVPGAGAALSGGIAASGTYSVGESAIAYYVNEMSMEEAKKVAEKAKGEIDNNKVDITEERKIVDENEIEKTLLEEQKQEIAKENEQNQESNEEKQENENINIKKYIKHGWF